MNSCSNKRSNNGQALIVTSLIIALLLISTICYVLETEKNTISLESTNEIEVSEIKESIRNTVISALANISNHGSKEVLNKDLEMLSTALHAHSYDPESDLSFTLFNSSTYQDGTWISWGDPGFGVSSACASFSINESGLAMNYFTTYKLNITTTLQIEGTCKREGAEETVNLNCTVHDENGPVLVNKLDILYLLNQTDGSWQKGPQQNNPPIGNGTYNISFTVYSLEPIKVSAQISDVRNIFVMANTTWI